MAPSLITRAAQVGIRALSRFISEPQVQPGSSKPDFGKFVSGIRDDYSVDRTLRQLTPEKLATAMKSADEGDVAAQYEVFELVEQDAHVASVWGKRRRAVLSREVQITSAIEEQDSAEGKRAQQAADLCDEVINGKWGQGGIDNWPEALKDLTDAIGKAFAVGQIAWELDAGRWLPKSIERWPQGQCALGTNAGVQNADEIRILTEENRIDGIPLAQWQWIAHVQKEWSQPIARASLFRGLTWFYLFKRFSWKDWVMFIERYGMPLRVGKYHPGASDTEKAALWKAVKELGHDAACIMPEQSAIELVEAKGVTGALPHPELIKHCNSEISKLVLGNPMTTEPGEKGARSLGEVYERGEDDMTAADCLNLARTIRRDLLTPIVGFNLGWDWPIPTVRFQSAEQVDLEKEAAIDEVLVTKIRLPLGQKYFYERYGRPMPEDGEELVSGPPAPIVMPPPSGQPPDEGEPAPDEPDASASSKGLGGMRALKDEKKKSRDWVVSKISLRASSR